MSGHDPSSFQSAFSISDVEFEHVRALVRTHTGINLGSQKKTLVVSRLGSRLRLRNLQTFAEYYRILKDPGEKEELQDAIDLITTNETSFFREPDHFNDLKKHIGDLHPLGFPFTVWSAASSSGEEAYSIAMVLADVLGDADWRVTGTDISTRVLARGRKGLYPIDHSPPIPKTYLKRFCLKGHGSQEGYFLVGRALRDRVTFLQANLCRPLPRLGPFDVAFLRNILIYFDQAQKQSVVESVVGQIKPGGLLIVGHSESLIGLSGKLEAVRPTVYRVRQGREGHGS